jgi:hypothetical protein
LNNFESMTGSCNFCEMNIANAVTDSTVLAFGFLVLSIVPITGQVTVASGRKVVLYNDCFLYENRYLSPNNTVQVAGF